MCVDFENENDVGQIMEDNKIHAVLLAVVLSLRMRKALNRRRLVLHVSHLLPAHSSVWFLVAAQRVLDQHLKRLEMEGRGN